jgi:hypothetical protein
MAAPVTLFHGRRAEAHRVPHGRVVPPARITVQAMAAGGRAWQILDLSSVMARKMDVDPGRARMRWRRAFAPASARAAVIVATIATRASAAAAWETVARLRRLAAEARLWSGLHRDMLVRPVRLPVGLVSARPVPRRWRSGAAAGAGAFRRQRTA